MTFSWQPRSLRLLINASLLMFVTLLALGLSVQGKLSQALVDHSIWTEVLESSTQVVLSTANGDVASALPTRGAVRGWLVTTEGAPPPSMPANLAELPPGYYRESQLDAGPHASFLARVMSVLRPRWGPFANPDETPARRRSYTALVTAVPQGRLVMAIDMTGLEDDQNGSVQLSVLFLIFNLILTSLVIWLFHLSLTRPIDDLARRMRDLNPLQLSQRLPTNYRKTELNTIAGEANAHLDRVEQAIERERSLLDQASHEFRTPVAVISGAADVLNKLGLEPRAQRPLDRIDEAVDVLTRIMDALLYLSREPSPKDRSEVTIVHGLLPALVEDHRYLLGRKPVELILKSNESTVVRAPESMVRIAVGNLLRNAVEHTHGGEVQVSLQAGVLVIRDSGPGFDAALVAHRYTESLKGSVPRAGGAGLGLFLTQRICERFRWRLRLASSPALGTSATIDFNDDPN